MTHEEEVKAMFPNARCIQAMVNDGEGEGMTYRIDGTSHNLRATFGSPHRAWEKMLNHINARKAKQ